jgi:hypothetical protein
MGEVESSMPEVVGLCPVHLHEFYAPHGGACPQCQRAMMEYVPRDRAAAERLEEWAESLDVYAASRDGSPEMVRAVAVEMRHYARRGR